jgi:AcrR family transcriptional regulator
MSTQVEMSERTKAALREAAIDSLCELGYVKTTGVEIARRAGVTRGALHHHFPRGKIDVFLDVITQFFQTADDRYQDNPVEYSEWFAGRLAHFEASEQNDATMREFWAALNIVMYIDSDADETEELRRTFEARNWLGLVLRDQMVTGTEAQKQTLLPFYQFMMVFLAGYTIYRFRLPNVNYHEGGRQFARHLLEVWMQTQTRPEEAAARP